MPKNYVLDKIFAANTQYRMEPDKYLIIKKLGTDINDEVVVKVDGQECGKIHNNLAPLTKTGSNMLGPTELGQYFIVVPPNKVLEFSSSSSGNVRAIGLIAELEAGETIPSEHLSRYNNRGNAYKTYFELTEALGTDEAIAAGREIELGVLKPTTIETFIFDDILTLAISGGSVDYGQLALRVYLDGKPLDNLDSIMGKYGIEALSIPSPPDTTKNAEPFTFRDNPITIEGDHELKFTIVNVSGSDLSPSSGSAWSFVLRGFYKYVRK